MTTIPNYQGLDTNYRHPVHTNPKRLKSGFPVRKKKFGALPYQINDYNINIGIYFPHNYIDETLKI